MANENCKFWQSQLDDQEKNLSKHKAFGKLPVGVLFSPYETFASFIKKKEESIAKLKNDIKINNCANDPSVKKYRREKCLSLNERITQYTSTIASDYQKYLNAKDVKAFVTGNFNLNVYYAENLKIALEDAKKDFINYNCAKEVEESRQEVVGSIASEYSAYDKERIEAESIYERNKRVFFGGVVLIFGLALIMTFKKSKK
jgi:hypothetical protein